MLTDEQVRTLLEAREIVDGYLRERRAGDRTALRRAEEALRELGIESFDVFWFYNNRAVQLEIAGCYKGVDRFTGLEPPLCDLCSGPNRPKESPIETPSCMRDPKTYEVLPAKTQCVLERTANKSIVWKSSYITDDEDTILQAQIRATSKGSLPIGIRFSLMDALDWWGYPDHVPPGCIAKIVETKKPRFELMWEPGHV